MVPGKFLKMGRLPGTEKTVRIAFPAIGTGTGPGTFAGFQVRRVPDIAGWRKEIAMTTVGQRVPSHVRLEVCTTLDVWDKAG